VTRKWMDVELPEDGITCDAGRTVGCHLIDAATWGPWRLDLNLMVLHAGDLANYGIELRSCTNSAAVLDWVMQVAGKSWVDRAALGGFVRAVDDLLRPQKHLCSFAGPFGRDGDRLTVGQIEELVRVAVADGAPVAAVGW
jgi:hypothetical protein